MKNKTFAACEDGDVILLSLICEANGYGDHREPATLMLLGECSSDQYGEQDALAKVAAGKADRVLVVKVLAVAQRTAAIVGRK
jgi:hypothetical protein